jgi:hypothetical protein
MMAMEVYPRRLQPLKELIPQLTALWMLLIASLIM